MSLDCIHGVSQSENWTLVVWHADNIVAVGLGNRLKLHCFSLSVNFTEMSWQQCDTGLFCKIYIFSMHAYVTDIQITGNYVCSVNFAYTDYRTSFINLLYDFGFGCRRDIALRFVFCGHVCLSVCVSRSPIVNFYISGMQGRISTKLVTVTWYQFHITRVTYSRARAASSLLTFRRETKSHLFRQSFGWRKSGAVSADWQLNCQRDMCNIICAFLLSALATVAQWWCHLNRYVLNNNFCLCVLL